MGRPSKLKKIARGSIKAARGNHHLEFTKRVRLTGKKHGKREQSAWSHEAQPGTQQRVWYCRVCNAAAVAPGTIMSGDIATTAAETIGRATPAMTVAKIRNALDL